MKHLAVSPKFPREYDPRSLTVLEGRLSKRSLEGLAVQADLICSSEVFLFRQPLVQFQNPCPALDLSLHSSEGPPDIYNLERNLKIPLCLSGPYTLAYSNSLLPILTPFFRSWSSWSFPSLSSLSWVLSFSLNFSINALPLPLCPCFLKLSALSSSSTGTQLTLTRSRLSLFCPQTSLPRTFLFSPNGTHSLSFAGVSPSFFHT